MRDDQSQSVAPSNITRIKNLDDPRVDVFRDVRDADLRGRNNLFMAESERVLRRLLRQPDRIHSVLITPGKLERVRNELTALPDDRPVYVADVELMSQIAGFHIHRGVLAAGYRLPADELTIDEQLGHLHAGFPTQNSGTAVWSVQNHGTGETPVPPTPSQQSFTLLLAEGLTNVDNMGALFRNAAAFGAAGIVLDPACCDPLYRKAIRVSMGHTLTTPYAISHDWPGDLQRMKNEWQCTVIGAESGTIARPLWELGNPHRCAIVFGAEAHGLRAETRRQCDALYEIPMAGNVPSLNVAVASAVFLYEITRQRENKSLE